MVKPLPLPTNFAYKVSYKPRILKYLHKKNGAVSHCHQIGKFLILR